MQLENYLEFLSPDDIRIKGTRIGIETVLEDYFEGAAGIRRGNINIVILRELTRDINH